MKNTWKWIFGIALVLLTLLILPFIWSLALPTGGYRMMEYGYGWHMAMIQGAGMMGFGMPFIWLTLLAYLLLIGFGVFLLIKTIHAPK